MSTQEQVVDIRTVRHAARIARSTSLVEPVRRPLLLAGMPARFIATLPVFVRPGDQLYADLLQLSASPAMLREWLENAELMAVSTEEEEIVRSIRRQTIIMKRAHSPIPVRRTTTGTPA